ncbi:HU family DNA-binding protein [Beduinella massiliensis]|uniref:HU family DNA-binding protein n=1 Tax=Beduinella massiliensis TaxID=1852363 RepID=UPI000C832C97
MNKTELCAAVAAKAGMTRKDAEAAVSAVIDVIGETLKDGEKVAIVGFGSFEVKERPARKARNPRTGEEIEIAASKAPAFKAGKALKDIVSM